MVIDRVKLLGWASLLVVLLDRLIFQRSLFADGACNFLNFAISDQISVIVQNRPAAFMLMNLPLAFAQHFGVWDLERLLFFWHLGFAVPFLMSGIVASFLRRPFSILAFFLLSSSVCMFYLPDSIFSIGEYNMMYPLVSVALPSLMQHLRWRDSFSVAVFGIAVFMMGLCYEIGAIYALVLCVYGFIILLISGRTQNGDRPMRRAAAGSWFMGLLSFSYWKPLFMRTGPIVYISVISIFVCVFSLKWVTSSSIDNAHAALTTYLVLPNRGAASDSWLYLICAVCICVVAVKFNYKKRSVNFTRLITFSIALIVGISLNHSSEHSYFSKTIYIPLFLVTSSVVCFQFNSKSLSLVRYLSAFVFVAMIVSTSFVLWEGIQFNRFLRKLASELGTLPPKTMVDSSSLAIYKQSWLGKRFNWSWGQVCLSVIVKRDGDVLARGPYDELYFPYYWKVIQFGRVH